MKKIFAGLLGFAFVFSSYAENSNVTPFYKKTSLQKTGGWHFSVEGLAGARLGVYNEIVWGDALDGSRYKLSELNWELKPAWYLGSKVSGGYKAFELNFSGKFFLPGRSGKMTDSDWNNGSYNNDTLTKTNISWHDNYLAASSGGFAGYDMEIGSCYKFFPTDFLTLRPLLSFNAQYMKFAGKDGYARYGNDVETDSSPDAPGPYYSYDSEGHVTEKSFSGNVILYDMYNFFIWTGIQADFILMRGITISLASEIAPFAFFLDYDYHCLRNLWFKDTASYAFLAFRQKIGADFRITDKFSCGMNCVFVVNSESVGKAYYKEIKSDYTKKGQGGGQITYCDIGITAKFVW